MVMLHDFAKILKSIELYLWYVKYISIKLLKIGKNNKTLKIGKNNSKLCENKEKVRS